MQWETFDKRSAAASKSPFVTIQKNNGPISLNKAAHDLMGNPETVELMFEPSQKLIGFKPVSSKSPKAFPVRPQGKNAATLMVAGQAFTKHYDIDTRVARRYPVEMRDGVLVLDLNGESIEVVSNRGRRSREEG
jgi:hypothetical protein